PVYEPKPGEVILWPETTVIGLFEANHDMQAVVDFVQSHYDKPLNYKLEQLEDKDWEREWMDNFHPIKFGERLWICP
ncbi:50S ribosomal protein L11 methyltransferase, partial [Pseudoalteromonas sp. S1941]